MGWCPVIASLELRTSIGTIMDLETGRLDDELSGPVVSRAAEMFKHRGLKIEHFGEAGGAKPPSAR